MKHGRRILAAALAIATVMAASATARAESQTAMPSLTVPNSTVPSQSDIERLLKTRGLPTPGMSAAPPAGPRQEFVPANTAVPNTDRSNTAGPAAESVASMQPSVTFNTITFEFGSAQLSPQAVETLRNLGGALNAGLSDQKEFLIEGHTDSRGTEAYNLDLSQRRADAVKDYLVRRLAVAPERLRTLGKGFSDPANPQNPYASENRRVVVINLGAHS